MGWIKVKLEVYPIMVGLYYGVNVDYASLLCEEFGNSISHSKLAYGVLSASFWWLILKEVYTQEYILFPTDVDIVEFPSMTAPNFFIDDATIFPLATRISDLMLNLVNPTQ